MQLRAWSTDGFLQDSFELTRSTTIEMGLRYEYARPLHDITYTNTNLTFQSGTSQIFIGGQNGHTARVLFSDKHKFAPRLGIFPNFPRVGVALPRPYRIFFSPRGLK